jgi:branched-subunit amino acid aminotransferase/4-amino-4-deoxychorismate lyase
MMVCNSLKGFIQVVEIEDKIYFEKPLKIVTEIQNKWNKIQKIV